jgi:ATP-dependent DNA ligase
VRVVGFNTNEGRRKTDRPTLRASFASAATSRRGTCRSSGRTSLTDTKAAIATCSYRCPYVCLIVAFQRKKPPVIGTKSNYPGFVEPELATRTENVPSGNRWLHEIKFDGYRVQVHLAGRGREDLHSTNRFRKIAADAWHVNAGSAIIDGEVVVPSADGMTDFPVLQNELKGRSKKIVLVAFDLLYLNGYDLRRLQHG